VEAAALLKGIIVGKGDLKTFYKVLLEEGGNLVHEKLKLLLTPIIFG